MEATEPAYRPSPQPRATQTVDARDVVMAPFKVMGFMSKWIAAGVLIAIGFGLTNLAALPILVKLLN